MRTGPAGAQRGYFHETAFYRSDEELLDLVVPFLQGGVAAGEPTLAAFDERNTKLVADALGDPTGITFRHGAAQYLRPAATIRIYRELFQDLVDRGAEQIRVVGDVPHPGVGVAWDEWARYEAAVNHAYDDFPLWGICPYDTRITPPFVLDEVERTHAHVARPDGRHEPCAAFEDPLGFARSRRSSAAPTGPAEPVLSLLDPSPLAARRALDLRCAEWGVAAPQREDLVLAVHEAVTNARRHGAEPIELRAWTEPGRIVVTVRDGGQGPQDPFAGLVGPPPTALTGRGLWIMHQLTLQVTMHFEADGFTVAVCAPLPVEHAA